MIKAKIIRSPIIFLKYSPLGRVVGVRTIRDRIAQIMVKKNQNKILIVEPMPHPQDPGVMPFPH